MVSKKIKRRTIILNSIGQGEILASSIQMANFTATIEIDSIENLILKQPQSFQDWIISQK